MNRTIYWGGWYCHAWPTGERCVLFPNERRIGTHLGDIPFPPNEMGLGPLHLVSTRADGFKFAGQSHTNPRNIKGRLHVYYEWTLAGWREIDWMYEGIYSCAYTLDGRLVINDGSAGSQGFRYAYNPAPASDRPLDLFATGDNTYGPFHELSEWSDLGEGLYIGQSHPDGTNDAAWIWDKPVQPVTPDVHHLLEEGRCTFIHRELDGDHVALSYVVGNGSVIVQATRAELRMLPLVGAPKPPDPPKPDPPKPDPPRPIPPSAFFHHRKGLTMEIDGLIVQLRGSGGMLISPDKPNTGTWGHLNKGWRGVLYMKVNTPAVRMRAKKLSNGRYTFTSETTNGLMGADSGQYSPALDKQGYFKPDGDTDAGGYEQWRVYDGNDNGAIEAQIEFETDEKHPAGPGKKFFGFPLAVEVL